MGWDDDRDEPLDPDIDMPLGEAVRAAPEGRQETREAGDARVVLSGELPSSGPRGELRRQVEDAQTELAGVVVSAALGKGSAERGRLALSAISQADPPQRVSVLGRIPRSVAEVQRLSLGELDALAEGLGLP